jgi:hypothetical protein
VNVEALRFVPVRVTEAPLSPSAVGAASVPKNRRGVAVGIEIVLPDGCRLLVSNEVSLTALRRVVAVQQRACGGDPLCALALGGTDADSA